METHKIFQFYCGIDPGVTTGVAVYSRNDKQIYFLETMKIHKALDWVDNWVRQHRGKMFIKVEDARQAVHGRKEKNYAIAQGAGSVKRDAQIWEDFLKDINADFVMVKPNKLLTKWNAEKFNTKTGWKKKSNEHARDAALLVIDF